MRVITIGAPTGAGTPSARPAIDPSVWSRRLIIKTFSFWLRPQRANGGPAKPPSG
ncbi:MAG: hypothetical protein HY474_01320 [Candidatus Sungbacteria bacterium]|uniref:Uncharacterized protein n=1 Tax=Candidatus Sungiibacteriota bacterium TaxID=2750080 RepID=A0A933DRE6_9BACT|nr:hypothetical protein [Candidatus Sungbacteria bacterium]